MVAKVTPVELTAPPLGSVLSYKVVYALCTINKTTRQLHATHYATCLILGPQPVWGVWRVSGVFQRFYGRKSDIADAYPKLAWRRKSGTWTLTNFSDEDYDERLERLNQHYKHRKKLDDALTEFRPDPDLKISNIVKFVK